MEGDPDKPWEIDADEINYDQETGRYVATGNVVITRNTLRLQAEYVEFDPAKMKAFAKGNVNLNMGEDTLLGSTMEMDLDGKIGTVTRGKIFVKEDNFHITGDKIQKINENTYTINRASVTTCDGESPDWKITGRDLKVTLEGYGFMWHAAFWVKKVPIFYSPFIFFPAKRDRQTGLLFPDFGTSSRQGFFYIQPFFWAIGDNMDATFYEHYMAKRGFKHGFEFRYVISEDAKGTMMFDYLFDEKIDDGITDNTHLWGYDDDNLLRTNRDRYWFRMSHHQRLPNDFYLKFDLDIISDQDYLNEFNESVTGFKETEDYFRKEFHREFDDHNDPVRVNRLNLTKNWFQYSLNAELRWYDDLWKRRWKDFETYAERKAYKIDNTLQKLPYIEFDATKQQIFASPFYFTFDSEYNYFFRNDLGHNDARGQRIDLYPRVYWPYRFKNYLTLEPSAGLRQTAWFVDKYGRDVSHHDKSLARTLYDIRLDLSSDISRVYPFSSADTEKIKHTIKPHIVYQYIPEKDQTRYPYFNSLDRIAEANTITYSITNLLTSKNRKITDGNAETGELKSKSDFYYYNDFFRFLLEQSYDFNENLLVDGKWRHFSPILAELEIHPMNYVSLEYDTEISPYTGNFLSHRINARLWDNRGDSLSAEYRFLKDDMESVALESKLKLFGGLSLYGEFEYNIFEEQKVKNQVGLIYEAQCWSFRGEYTDLPDDNKIEFLIDLYGLGELKY